MKKANKKLASAIVLGLMLAVPVGASAEQIVDENYQGTDSGIVIADGSDVVYKSENGFVIAHTGEGAQVYGVKTTGSSADSRVELDAGNGTIEVNVTGGTSSAGLAAIKADENDNTKSEIVVNGNALDINVTSSANGAGIWVQNHNEKCEADDKRNTVTINTDALKIDVEDKGNNGFGIINFSGGIVEINSKNVEITSDSILGTRGNAVTKINANNDKDAIIKLNGNIEFQGGMDDNSGKISDASVIINLTNDQSYLNGCIMRYADKGQSVESSMTLGLSNGAIWNVGNTPDWLESYNPDEGNYLDNLNFNGGIINMIGDKDQIVNIENIEGTGGTVNIKAEIENDSVTSGKLNIGKEEEGATTVNTLLAKNTAPKLDVNFTGVTADDITVEQFQDLSKNINITSGQNVTASSYVADGIVTGGYSASIAANGEGVSGDVNVKETSETMDNMRDIASVALVAWRQEDSTLSQRLGELRNSEGDQGIWARMSRGEFEYGGAFKNQYNYFQLGYDWAAGDWHYGAAISHNDGQTTYASGSGENDSTSLTLYGTWLGDKGQYTDIVVKQGKLNNEFTNYAEAGTTTGDYDMWGTSISAEYGQKLEMKNDWYVTPQAQLTYMRIGGEDYTAIVTKEGKSNPMQVSQDGMDSFVGRIGFEAGKNISEKGSIYAKASLLHEFAGEADTTLVYMGKPGTYSQDLGDTWYECGFGVNYKTSDNSYVYADVVKTFGGDVETPWQWNAGMRWSF